MRKLALLLSGSLAALAGMLLEGGCKQDCQVGSEGCDCTGGGACDPGLACLSGLCVNAGPDEVGDETSGDGDGDGDSSGDGDGDGDGDSTGDGDGDGESTDDGPKLDTLPDDESADDGPCVDTGCKKVDMLFALDGSASMIQEIDALKAGQAFLGIVTALENLNCGSIDYRVGVTGDNDNGWIVPNGWASADPWFDSAEFSAAQISVHFQAAATKVGQTGGAPLGCEHVLSSSVGLLDGDSSGFVRPDALLVLVVVTDVDDYGAYDQIDGNSCMLGCGTPGASVQSIYDTALALKGGDPAGLAAIVIAGDPSVNGGVNFCDQPQSCGSTAFHATRLYEYAGLHAGMNGFTADICDGAAAVPAAVQTALGENVDLACQEFEPEG